MQCAANVSVGRGEASGWGGGGGWRVHLASYNWNAEYSTDLSPPLIYFDVFQLRNNYHQTVSVLLPILQIRCICTVGRMMEKVGDREKKAGGGGGGGGGWRQEKEQWGQDGEMEA